MMKFPQNLTPGDAIHLVAPARWVEEELVIKTEAILANQGFRAIRSRHLLAKEGQFAGSAEMRKESLQEALDSPSSKAVLCMRGGYGCQHFVDQLDLSGLSQRPKWFIGFSDMTSIHGRLTKHGIASIHGPMPSTFESSTEESVQRLMRVLENGLQSLSFKAYTHNVVGECSGKVVGGNLSIVHCDLATMSSPIFDGSILFLEEVDEMLYHVDRMLNHMKRLNAFKALSGVILGGFSQMRDNTLEFGFSTENPFGKGVESILAGFFCSLGVPVAFRAPFGHTANNMPLILGQNARLIVDAEHVVVDYT